MPSNPKVYTTTNAPTTPEQGDLLFDPSNSSLRVFNGSTWVGLRLAGNVVMTDAVSEIVPGATSLSFRNNADSADNLIITDAGAATFRGAITTTGVTPSAGFASTNAATPGWYIPGEAGVPTGLVASLAKRVALYYDTTNNRLAFRNGGSWYATASLALL